MQVPSVFQDALWSCHWLCTPVPDGSKPGLACSCLGAIALGFPSSWNPSFTHSQRVPVASRSLGLCLARALGHLMSRASLTTLSKWHPTPSLSISLWLRFPQVALVYFLFAIICSTHLFIMCPLQLHLPSPSTKYKFCVCRDLKCWSYSLLYS